MKERACLKPRSSFSLVRRERALAAGVAVAAFGVMGNFVLAVLCATTAISFREGTFHIRFVNPIPSFTR